MKITYSSMFTFKKAYQCLSLPREPGGGGGGLPCERGGDACRKFLNEPPKGDQSGRGPNLV